MFGVEHLKLLHETTVFRNAAACVHIFQRGLLELVYPSFCVICTDSSEEYLCEKCVDRITLIEPPTCRKCGAPSETATCRECSSKEFAFESAQCAAVYEGVLREAVHQLKYRCFAALAEPLGNLMAERLIATRLRGSVNCVVPIPIHRSRMSWRGFNQAEALAIRICARTSLPLHTDVLYQSRKTKHQVDLSEEQRIDNVRGAFAVRNAERILGKHVLLVDDVFTTGSTLNEAAAALLSAGAKTVKVYALARSV